jgi:hypothetical protein
MIALGIPSITVTGWPIYRLLTAALPPVLYSLFYSKQLERRGELNAESERNQ